MDANLPTEIPTALEMPNISEKLSNLDINQATATTTTAPSPSSSSDPEAAAMLDSAAASAAAADHNGPIVLIVVGMAGSGKTTLTQRLTAECMQRKSPPYIINLDPACHNPPYPVNIDIRDTVNYKKVMQVYNLGPNGAIVTSLNLFATKFNQVLSLLLEKKKKHQYIIIDTPGQIEVFMWSASGSIITESLAALFPTVLIYVTDLITNKNPVTFISNMTYACSILYKTKLPLVITLNKRDQVDPSYAMAWITDYEAFEEAVRMRDDYSANLASSLALSMEEFYKNIDFTVVSAAHGFGMDEFFNAVQKAVTDYETVYRPMYQKMQEDRIAEQEKRKTKQMQKLRKDLSTSARSTSDDTAVDDPSCFIRSGHDAGAGLSLRLDDEDEDTSDEDAEKEDNLGLVQRDADDQDEETFSETFTRHVASKKDANLTRDPTMGGK